MKKSVIVALVAVMAFAGVALAGRMKHETRLIDAEGAERLVLNLDFGAGELLLTSEDIEEAARLELDYDSRNVDVEIDYHTRNSVGYLDLESERRRSTHFDTEDNQWEIVLSNNRPVTLDMDLGACEADMEFGGVPLERITLDIGAASGVITFSKPNPIRLKEFEIDAGACSIEMNYIGNANFDLMEFSGGVGAFELDFRGEYNGESVVDIEIGLGSADLTFPEGVPIRIVTEGSNWLSSIDFHGDDLEKVGRDTYESEDFDEATTRIVVNIEIGLGSIDIYWK